MLKIILFITNYILNFTDYTLKVIINKIINFMIILTNLWRSIVISNEFFNIFLPNSQLYR